jgi:hypothetical protein
LVLNLLITSVPQNSFLFQGRASAIQIEYKFNPKWLVRGTRDQNGGFGVDGRYRKDF